MKLGKQLKIIVGGGPGAQGEKFQIEIRKSTSWQWASGPREKKVTLKLGKKLGVRVGGRPRGQERKS